jgi:hypothetical protein
MEAAINQLVSYVEKHRVSTGTYLVLVAVYDLKSIVLLQISFYRNEKPLKLY